MNLHDFKLWLSGFEAAFEDGCPNAKQYAVLRQKLDEVHISHGPLSPVPFRYSPERLKDMEFGQ